MALSQQLVQKQTQRLVMTQDLRQSIELLPLSNLELSERIQTELLENPLLELKEEEETTREAPQSNASEDDARESESRSREEYSDYGQIDYEGAERKNQFLQNAVTSHRSLQEYLIEQLRLTNLSPPEFEAATILVSAIDQKGFLTESPELLLDGQNLPSAAVHKILSTIRELDPPGCGVSGVQEALLVQAALQKAEPFVLKLLEHHFEDLERLDYKKIEKETGSNEARIHSALQFIRTLEPFPGTLYSTREPDYVVPDLIVVNVEDRIDVLINDDWIPSLQINESYKQLLSDGKQANAEYLESKLSSATWLLRGIKQRRQTLYRTMKAIVEHQEPFFRQGHGHLVPLTLREVADDLEMHESTISRITTNKYVQTRWGIFELKYFFTSALRKAEGGRGESSTNIKDRLQKLVDSEDPSSPLSDQEIADRIAGEGVSIARRTVAKYRKVLNIPSAERRRILKSMK
ncbi:MAG: RNA polymerase factor sigma-54 [Leptospiraceae bacterium]|nr:RNA polymerase factor sigma-54 [Leptospiraceae bacterium]MCB1303998.1 RNA polymerase factor sigma-54 [Leptospiraceae bacterium]